MLPVTLERLTKYDPNVAAQLGMLKPFLSERLDSDPLPEELLQDIITSDDHDLIVAYIEEDDGQNPLRHYIGMAAVSLTRGPMQGVQAHLADLVIHPDARGNGVGSKLWEEVIRWCQEKDASALLFTSNKNRTAARALYSQQGARIIDTDVWRIEIPHG